jgi:hypothetical protein
MPAVSEGEFIINRSGAEEIVRVEGQKESGSTARNVQVLADGLFAKRADFPDHRQGRYRYVQFAIAVLETLALTKVAVGRAQVRFEKENENAAPWRERLKS